MPDFLLELRSEEIPARMQDKARDDLARLFAAEIAKAGLKADAIVTYATPRRLALIAKDLPPETQSVSEETKGPKISAPAQALEGFLRKTGLTQDQLEDRNGIWFAVVEKPGRATADVLAEAIPAIVRAFPWPKSMRWGAASASTESMRWVRPLQGVVAILGEDVVPCEAGGLLSGYQTLGHRFHHPGVITIGGAHDYVEKLRACHVIVDQDERRALIRDGAAKVAVEAGLALVEDEGLVAENAGLTEWPVPLLGRFDPAFLEVPQEVIQLTARVNQKYFVCTNPPRSRGGGGVADGGGAGSDEIEQAAPPLHRASSVPLPVNGEDLGALAPAFVCTANIDATDGGAAVIAGNEKVLAARLSDAKFFWEQDLKVPLAEQAEKLSQIVFHEKLGTVADKVERVAKLARWLCEQNIVTYKPLPFRGGVGVGTVSRSDDAGTKPHPPTPYPSPEGEGLTADTLADLAERAARLCKADLVTGMVGEFPELQGIMGGHLARAQGEPDAIADAIRDHYKPVGQGDDVPTAPVTVAVSLADKLDTLVGFFSWSLFPTGSKDPFALRRAAVAMIELAIANNLRFKLSTFLYLSLGLHLLTRNNEMVGPWRDIVETFPYLKTSEQEKIYEKIVGPDPSGVSGLLHPSEVAPRIESFLADRLKVQQREAGVRHDLIDAVFSLGGEDDLVRLLARVKALQSFIETAEGADLLAAYRRAANILKQAESETPPRSRGGGGEADGGGAGSGSIEPGTTPPPPQAVPLPVNGEDLAAPLSTPAEQQIPQTGEEDPFVEVDQGLRKAIAENPGRTEGTIPEGATAADIALLGALDIEASKAKIAIEEERFEDAMKALAALREPIDRFFDEVMVNDQDPQKRAFRLGLLARFRDAVHQVADFSKIEG